MVRTPLRWGKLLLWSCGWYCCSSYQELTLEWVSLVCGGWSFHFIKFGCCTVRLASCIVFVVEHPLQNILCRTSSAEHPLHMDCSLLPACTLTLAIQKIGETPAIIDSPVLMRLSRRRQCIPSLLPKPLFVLRFVFSIIRGSGRVSALPLPRIILYWAQTSEQGGGLGARLVHSSRELD